MVGVARLELAASWSRTMRATICATPRCSFFIIMITHTVVKYQFSFYREICEICRFLFSEEMFLSVIFILTAFRNPTIIKPLRSALSCKLCTAASLLFSFFQCCENIKMPRRLSRHFYGGRYRTRTCDPPHVKRMLIPAELIVRVSVGYSNASASFCQPLFSTAPIIFGAVEHGALYFAVI